MSLVISNTSPLTNLAVIGRLELVRAQLGLVTVPAAVWKEMLALPHRDGLSALLAARSTGWLCVVVPREMALTTSLRLAGLGAGEAEAIGLAVESPGSLLLIDEKKGRAAARRLGLRIAGALAIIAAARVAGTISSVKAELDRLRSEAGFYVSTEVERHTLRIAGET